MKCPHCRVWAAVKSAANRRSDRTGVPLRVWSAVDRVRTETQYHAEGHPEFADIARVCYLPKSGVYPEQRAYLEQNLPLDAADAALTAGLLWRENQRDKASQYLAARRRNRAKPLRDWRDEN